jgi:glycosyltransferase involved in cell wall biosynthesis
MNVVAIIPAHNEATHVAEVVRGAKKHVDVVVVVDDGSTDRTAKLARQAGALVVSHAFRCGPGAATMTGISAARALEAGAVVTIDADGQHNPDDIPQLLAPLRAGQADVVIGTRFWGGRDLSPEEQGITENTIPCIRKIFNGLGNVFTFFVTGRYVSDSQSGFKVFGHAALETLDLHLSGFEFCSEIIREIEQHRWRVIEVPIRVTYSEYTLAKGQSFSSGVITACKMLLRSFLR